MVRAWYMDTSDADQRLPHMTDPPHFLSLEELKSKTGIEYFKVSGDDYKVDEVLLKVRRERGYDYEDVCDIKPDTLPDYDNKLKIFYQEHIHTDEEIRMIVDGSGYFDARDVRDQWIRVEVVKGDMIILPAGIYHRFTMDTNNYVKAARYFVGEPVWTPHNRPAEEFPARKEYLHKMTAVTQD